MKPKYTLSEFAEDCSKRKMVAKVLQMETCTSCAYRRECQNIMRLVRTAEDPEELVDLLKKVGGEV